jgi:hypothetical protein
LAAQDAAPVLAALVCEIAESFDGGLYWLGGRQYAAIRVDSHAKS